MKWNDVHTWSIISDTLYLISLAELGKYKFFPVPHIRFILVICCFYRFMHKMYRRAKTFVFAGLMCVSLKTCSIDNRNFCWDGFYGPIRPVWTCLDVLIKFFMVLVSVATVSAECWNLIRMENTWGHLASVTSTFLTAWLWPKNSIWSVLLIERIWGTPTIIWWIKLFSLSLPRVFSDVS